MLGVVRPLPTLTIDEMKRYRYTFFVPAYKIEYFEDALRSLIGQTYRNFRIVVSDDCSPMPLRSVFDKVVSESKDILNEGQIVFLRNEKNFGSVNLVDHWNSLVEKCNTDYLIMASDDDIYAPTFLEDIEKLAQKYPAADLFCTRVQRINENDEVTAIDAPTEEFENQVDFLYGLYVLRRLKCIGNYVFKTSAIQNIGGFINFPCAWGSDDITVSALSKNGVGITSEVLFSFRMSGKNISSTNNVELNGLKVKARMQNLEWFEAFVKHISSDGKLLTKYRLISYEEFYRREWVRSIVSGAEFLRFKQWQECYRWLVKHNELNGVMAKIHFLWTWIRAFKMRKV